MKQLGLFISICILMGACVSEYEPNYENQLEGLLVGGWDDYQRGNDHKVKSQYCYV